MSVLLFEAQSLNGDPDIYMLDGSAYTDLTQSVAGGVGAFLTNPADSSGQLPVVFGYGDEVYFQGFTNGSTTDVWSYNIATTQLTDIDASNAWGSGLSPNDFVAYGGRVYFVGEDAAGQDTLWTTNGAASGTIEVENSVTDFGSMAGFDGLLYFNGDDGDGNNDLYAYSRVTGATVQVGPAGLAPSWVTPAITNSPVGGISDDLFMAGQDSGGNRGLFVDIGGNLTELTTRSVDPTDLVVMTYDVSSASPGQDVSLVYFVGADGGGNGLWDASATGASEIVSSSFSGVTSGLGLDPRDLTPLNGELYFIGDDTFTPVTGGSGSGLFVYDPATGTTTELIESSSDQLDPDLALAQQQAAVPATLAAYDDDLFFNADPGDGVPDLFEYNPSAQQTTLIQVGNYNNGDGFEGGASPYDLINTAPPQNIYAGGGYVLSFGGAEGAAYSLAYTAGDRDTVTGSDGALFMTDAAAAVAGGGDTINFVGGSGDVARLLDTDGVRDKVIGSGGKVKLVDSQAKVFGGGDVIRLLGSSGDDVVKLTATGAGSDKVHGSNAKIVLIGAQASLTGSDDSLHLHGDNSVTTNGASDAFVFQPNIGLNTINGFAATDRIQFSVSDFASWLVLQNDISQSGANAVITLDASNAVALTNVTAANLTSSQFHLV